MAKNFNVSADKRRIMESLAAFIAGVLVVWPCEGNIQVIYSLLNQSAREGDSSYLLIAMVRLFLMNCIRTTPVYLGAILAGEGMEITLFGRRLLMTKGFLVAAIMIVFYRMMNFFTGIDYHFGVPAMATIFIVSFLEGREMFEVNLFGKGVIIAMVILTMQTLTVIPNLTMFGFGKGEIAVDIKHMALLLGYDEILTMFSVFLFLLLFAAFLIVVKLVNDEVKLKKSAAQRQVMEKQLAESRIKDLEYRTLKEIQNLVHDLKTPLTSVQGLASLSEILTDQEQIKEYQSRIVASVDTMNGMISEILYEERKMPVSMREIVKMISSYVAINDRVSRMVQYENHCPEKKIYANKIRLIRAIINVIENAAAAISRKGPEKGEISVIVDEDREKIRIRVVDNGTGIPADELKKIWDSGYSTNSSTGLGLSFTQNVVANHGGEIRIDSYAGKQTCVSIWIGEVGDEKQNCNR